MIWGYVSLLLLLAGVGLLLWGAFGRDRPDGGDGV